MFIKLTPKKTQDAKIGQLISMGVLDTEEIHLNPNDISTVAFGEGVAQIRLTSAARIDIDVPEEIEQLKRLVDGEL